MLNPDAVNEYAATKGPVFNAAAITPALEEGAALAPAALKRLAVVI